MTKPLVMKLSTSGISKLIQDGSTVFMEDFEKTVADVHPSVERCLIEESEIRVLVDTDNMATLDSLPWLEKNIMIMLARYVIKQNDVYNGLIMRASWEAKWMH